MAIDFLNAEQRQAYGNFSGDPTPAQLTRFCYLDQADHVFIKARRTAPALQLGFALQLMTVRFLGTFLEDPLHVPDSVVAFAAEQLGIADWSDLPSYWDSRARFANRRQIRERYGYTDFNEPAAQWSLLRWLYARAWHSADKPVVLFDTKAVPPAVDPLVSA